MNEIKCTVDNCIHHCGTNSCDAKEITVGQKNQTEAACDCCQTECDTFRPKQ